MLTTYGVHVWQNFRQKDSTDTVRYTLRSGGGGASKQFHRDLPRHAAPLPSPAQ